MNLKEQIAAAADRRTQPLEVPEWGCTLHLKELSVGERMKLFDLMADDNNKDKLLYVYAILATVADADGNRIFTTDDYDLIAGKNSDVVLRLGKECANFNKLVGQPIEDAKKNSEPTQNEQLSTNCAKN
jgi:hypothetical protein